MKAVFPEKQEQTYYELHVKYLINIFGHQNIPLSFEPMPFVNETAFPLIIDDKPCIIDFSDSGDSIIHSEHPVFKFHCKTQAPGIYPLPPISFHDWTEYNKLKDDISYTCNNDIILNNQLPYGNARERRDYIRELLKMYYPDTVDAEMTEQLAYWKKINNCLCHVFVPGQNNNILDRGQIQYLAFGCCTISPKLPEFLPFNTQLEPEIHYIMCDDRYRELSKKIEWIKCNRDKAIEIGNNAKKLFEATSTPEKVIEWMNQCLEKH
jgi:hypothetical protein